MNSLQRLAELIHVKKKVEDEIAHIIGRPALIQHVGEYIAAHVFNIQLEYSASHRGIDGHFIGGVLAGRSVNIKWYTKQEGLLDITREHLPDFYLVMTGPKSGAFSSRGTTRPWIISSVFLFDSHELIEVLLLRGVKIGIATSIVARMWNEAQIYPLQQNSKLALSSDQRKQLALFG